MDLKALLDCSRGLEMSEKQAKGIEEQEKLVNISKVQTVKEGKLNTKIDYQPQGR